jgi:LuxR family maltose regulon positive regulatory protein
MQQDPLLKTKLYIPPVRPELVSRPRLIERLNVGMMHKLTLVSAPAGFGKTTLLSEWVAGNEQTELKVRLAWLSLDEGDNDLTRFLTYFVAALQTIDHDVGQGLLAALRSPGTVNVEAVLTSLVNDIARLSDNIAVVLDDYHVIESEAVDKALTFLLDHLPPPLEGMHLVIASRIEPTLPLSRLRARGQLTELRSADLRFTTEEAAAFLNKVVRLPVSPDDVRALESRTEGWITGLQLAAMAMQGFSQRDQISDFVHGFSGSHRYVIDYLVDEVLDQQTPSVQEFLFRTSILDRMTAPLCSAVTGREDSQAILEGLEAANLFLIPLDDERCWYRYHHLFGDLLKRRLNQAFPEQIAELHQRASIWYQESGDIGEAIHHALAAGNIDQTADILKDHWQVFFVRGELTKLKSILDSLGPEATDNSVILRMAYCMVYSQTGAIELIPSHTAYIRRRIKDVVETDVKHLSNLAAIPSLFETMEAIVALENGQAKTAKEHAKKAISLIPDDASPVDRRRLILAAYFRLGQAHRELGEFDEACSILLEVLEMLKATESFYVISTAIQVVAIYQELGSKQEALTLCENTLDFAAKKHWDEMPPVGLVHVALAGLQADAGDYQAARENLDTGRGMVERAITQEIISMVNRVEEKLARIAPPSQPLVEPLSERELEVLQLIAQGLSNREISQRLFLALSTIKGHNQNIYGKLQVQRRTEAVARARELGLL